MEFFCQKHSGSEDPISVIAKILSNNDSAKHEEILNKFKLLGFHNVKDLAQATLEKVCQMSIGDDSLAQLNSAMQTYDEICAERLFKSAKSLYEEGNYVSSQEACEKLYALKPNDLKIVFLMSSNYFKLEQYDKSLECLYKVPEEFRDCVEVINNIAANHLKKGQFPEACNAYQSAISKNQNFTECWLSYIVTLIEMDNHETATEALKMVIQYKPDLPGAYILYGRLLLKLNKYKEARSNFQKAIQLEPESDPPWVGIADSFAHENQFYSAIICYSKALEINGSLIIPHVNIGFMYYQLKQFGKSIFFLRTAIGMNPPKSVDILYILAQAYYYNNNFGSAVETYSLCLKDEPNNSVIFYNMGVIYLYHLRNAEAAEPYFKSCIDLDKSNILCYESLGIVYQQLAKADLAFKTVLKLSELYILKSDYTNGINVLLNARNLFPNNYYFNYKLALIFKKLEQDNRNRGMRMQE